MLSPCAVLRASFAPMNICYDPVTAVIAVTTIASAGLSYNNSRRQAKAVRTEGALKAQQTARNVNKLAASQRSAFLNSGIALTGEGTPQALFDDTFNTGLADIDQIRSNYQQQSDNIMSKARSQFLSSLGRAAISFSDPISSSASSSSGIPELTDPSGYVIGDYGV